MNRRLRPPNPTTAVGRWSGARGKTAAALAVGVVAAAVLSPSLVAGRQALRVTYSGPRTLTEGTALRAATPLPPQRVVAVSFMLDGVPVGSDTTSPYAVPLLPGEVTPGKHALTLQLVERTGSRTLSSPIDVVVRAGPPRTVLMASPQKGLKRALAALQRGGATVRLLPGRYELSGVRLGSGSTLLGSGPKTVIAAPSGHYESVLNIVGSTVRVANLVIDGGGAGSGEAGGGTAVAVQGSSHLVLLRHVRIVRTRVYGVYASGQISDVSVQDSTITSDRGGDTGVFAAVGSAFDVSVVRTTISGFRSYGINFAQPPHGNYASGLRSVALDNTISDIVDTVDTQGRSQGGIWTGGALASIIGNRITRTGWDGIETVGSSDGVVVIRNRISATGTAIYIEHQTTHSLIADNSTANIQTGIKVEWTYGGIGSTSNRFVGNVVDGASEVGLFLDVGSNDNLVTRNTFRDVPSPAIVLQGASRNVVTKNVLCGTPGPFVAERTGLWDDNSPATTSENVIQPNRVASVCSPP
jgi:Right handed beta helix region